MELRQLEHFVAVAESGSFKGAAARCHIVQSGLSASIRALEAELGARLFNRTTRHVELTDAGEALLEQATRTLAAAAAAREAVSDVEHLLRGTLAIGVSWENQAVDLPKQLAQFHLEHPQLAVNILQGASGSTLDRVAAGVIDLAFLYLADEPPDTVRTETLARGSMVLVCSSEHRLAGAAEVDLTDLADEDFVNAPRDLLSRAVDAEFEARDLSRTNRFAVHSIETQLDLVAAGLGVAILPDTRHGGPSPRHRYAALLDPDRPTNPPVSYVPLAGDPLHWTFVSVLPARSRPTPAARTFLDIIATGAQNALRNRELDADDVRTDDEDDDESSGNKTMNGAPGSVLADAARAVHSTHELR